LATASSRSAQSQGHREESASREALAARFDAVCRQTEQLCLPLAIEDFGLQGMADTSPVKWHLAHTAWFFETFVLSVFITGYRAFHPRYQYLFNSYYDAIGEPFPRAMRGQLSRPTVAEVRTYRAHVQAGMRDLLAQAAERDWSEIALRCELGCHHEEQHQELILTDLKYCLALNPLRPAYRGDLPVPAGAAPALRFDEHTAGLREIGHAGGGFAFDNETPRHRAFLAPFALGSRLVTAGEYLEFIEAGGYTRPEHWLSDGFRTARERNWAAPLYWERQDGRWWQFTLGGVRALGDDEPVCHVSFYEADAYARFRGRRLPTEAEWEAAAAAEPVAGNLRERGFLHPAPAPETRGPAQLFGDVWEWTRSSYGPYPGYRAAAGALGEYNGKFMANQMVLRGGSCVTPAGHIRASYRNFFYPADRWQFMGIRLAEDR
jgi:ergothioneine biosynthesis protein EgtB